MALPAFAAEPHCTTGQMADNSVVYSCQGLSKSQSAGIQKILNMIVSDQIDPDLVLEKMRQLPQHAGATIVLTDAQKQNVTAIAGKAPGARVEVRYRKGDANGAKTAAELITLFAAGHWTRSDGSPLTAPSQYVTEETLTGISVGVNSDDLSQKKYPNGAVPLSLSLSRTGLGGMLFGDSAIPKGTFELRVGPKH